MVDPAYGKRRKREPPVELVMPKPKVRVFTRAETDQIIRQVKHGLCVEHVRVAGLAEPVCITKRDDREQVLRDVAELLNEGATDDRDE